MSLDINQYSPLRTFFENESNHPIDDEVPLIELAGQAQKLEAAVVPLFERNYHLEHKKKLKNLHVHSCSKRLKVSQKSFSFHSNSIVEILLHQESSNYIKVRTTYFSFVHQRKWQKLMMSDRKKESFLGREIHRCRPATTYESLLRQK